MIVYVIRNDLNMLQLIENGYIKFDSNFLESISICVLNQFSCWLICVSCIYFAHGQIFPASLGFVSISYFNIQFKQNHIKLYSALRKRGQFYWISLKQCWSNDLKMFEFLFVCDRFFRNIFFTFILIVSSTDSTVY